MPKLSRISTVRGCKPSACPVATRDAFLSTILQEILYRLAQAAATKPAGPAPMMRRSTCETDAGAILRPEVSNRHGIGELCRMTTIAELACTLGLLSDARYKPTGGCQNSMENGNLRR
jgi:hypothetical protein